MFRERPRTKCGRDLQLCISLPINYSRIKKRCAYAKAAYHVADNQPVHDDISIGSTILDIQPA